MSCKSTERLEKEAGRHSAHTVKSTQAAAYMQLAEQFVRTEEW